MSKTRTIRQEQATERLAKISQAIHDCLISSQTAMPETAAQALIEEFMDAAWDFSSALDEVEGES